MELPDGFLVGLVLGGILGFALGFLVTTIPTSAKEKLNRKERKAEKLFDFALEQEEENRKLELLGKILDKFPDTSWAEKALEEVMKIKKKGKGDT